MKKVVSVVTAPFRFIGRLLLKLLRKLRLLKLLGRPLKKLSRLRGRKLVIALVPVAIVVVVLVLALKPAPDPEKQVRETLDRYAAATRDKDYQTLCDELLAAELLDRLRNVGLPCEVALRTGLERTRNPTLKVMSVEVNGDEALAGVRGVAIGESPGTSTYRLVREDGRWRIATPPGSQQPGAIP